MEEEFLDRLLQSHQESEKFPGSGKICDFTNGILCLLFPALNEKKYSSGTEIRADYNTLKDALTGILKGIISIDPITIPSLVERFIVKLPQVYDALLTDISAIVLGDPAARDDFEVVRAYPGFYAIAMYRIAHELHLLKIPVVPRIVTEFAHTRTGIDIHPGASISSHFCIDHGTGVVIGETTVIGKHVKLYQGVTLGALSVDKSMAQIKRHPTIEDHVVIYSGATILGGGTTIGSYSVIGGNVWLTKSVSPYSTVYYKAQIEVGKDALRQGLSNS